MEFARTRLTAHEFYQMPETMQPMQLLDGEIIQLTGPTLEHQDVVLNIGTLFKAKRKTFGGRVYIAPVDVELSDVDVPQPDALWIAPNSPTVMLKRRIIGAPDLIVEVLSPSTAELDRTRKFRLYERHGVQEYWLIDIQTYYIELWTLNSGRYELRVQIGKGETLHSPLLGNFQADDIFEIQE